LLSVQVSFLARQTLYLDPGSGSLLIQLLLAALLGAGVLVKVFWRKIKTLFGMASTEDPETGEDDDGD
jgi:hypothetical protein